MADDTTPAEGDELILTPEDQAQEPAEGDNEPNEAIVNLAQEMGWRPKEEFKGAPDQWKPADQFIRDGHEIQRNLGKELKNLRSTVDTMQRTSTTLLESRIAEEKAKLSAEYEAAVDDGDHTKAAEKLRSLDKLDIEAPAKPSLSAEAQSFQDRHASWLGKDVLATDRAVEICNKLAAAGKSQAEQLEEAEKAIRRERPDLFPQPAKRQAAVHEGTRAAGKPNGKQGFANLPPEAQAVALDMEERLKIPRETYAANFFNSQQPAQRRA